MSEELDRTLKVEDERNAYETLLAIADLFEDFLSIPVFEVAPTDTSTGQRVSGVFTTDEVMAPIVEKINALLSRKDVQALRQERKISRFGD
jgi:hypothetical protein